MDNVGSILTYEGACVATFYVYSYAMNKTISIMILENINRKRWTGTQN
jgi:hypothetical protein